MSKFRWSILTSIIVVMVLGIFIFGVSVYRHAWNGFQHLPFGIASSPAPSVGSEAPDFKLESLAGEEVSLENHQNIPVVINFWTTWCAQCVLEMPGFERTYQKYQGKLRVVAINAGETSYRVHQFVKDIGITFDVLLDPDRQIQGLYEINGFPTTFILDKNRIIRVKHVGQLDEDQLASYLNQIGIVQ